MSALLRVELPRFEGPLALLIHLIRQHEMDIFDIPIHLITEQYLNYLQAIKEMDLEVAGEFISMAATLLHIKSMMLLPQASSEDSEEDIQDPRKPLVQKLIEYERYRKAALMLAARPRLYHHCWPSGFQDHSSSVDSQQEVAFFFRENPVFALMRCYRILSRRSRNGMHRVGPMFKSIAQKVEEFRKYLGLGDRKTLRDLVNAESFGSFWTPRLDLLVSFLAILELAKMGLMKLIQAHDAGEIYVELVRPWSEAQGIRWDEFENLGSTDLLEEEVSS